MDRDGRRHGGGGAGGVRTKSRRKNSGPLSTLAGPGCQKRLSVSSGGWSLNKCRKRNWRSPSGLRFSEAEIMTKSTSSPRTALIFLVLGGAGDPVHPEKSSGQSGQDVRAVTTGKSRAGIPHSAHSHLTSIPRKGGPFNWRKDMVGGGATAGLRRPGG